MRFFKQSTKYDCGVIAMLNLLRLNERRVTYRDCHAVFAKEMKLNQGHAGIYLSDFIKLLRKLKFTVNYLKTYDSVMKELRNDRCVAVMYRRSTGNLHLTILFKSDHGGIVALNEKPPTRATKVRNPHTPLSNRMIKNILQQKDTKVILARSKI